MPNINHTRLHIVGDFFLIPFAVFVGFIDPAGLLANLLGQGARGCILLMQFRRHGFVAKFSILAFCTLFI